MNKFLESFFKKSNEKPELEKLEKLQEWGKGFWSSYAEERKSKFAQQGYEDKGYGHIERIISNVGELLQNYCEALYELNFGKGNNGETSKSRKDFESEFLAHLEPNLIMFYTAAYLHDIGMGFAGIFEALEKIIKGGGESALHVSEIIHNYHHYTSFIVLLEMSYINIKEIEQELKKSPAELEAMIEKFVNEKASDILKDSHYLNNIPDNIKIQSIGSLVRLKIILKDIYNEYFIKVPTKNGFKDENEFFVVLAILCLLHKEVNHEYVKSIIRNFKDDHKETIDHFNKWWEFLNRAREWTKTAPRWLQEKLSQDGKKEDIFPELITCKSKNSPEKEPEKHREKKLDLLLVEALLQYGDKTEITIARLSRYPKVAENDQTKEETEITIARLAREPIAAENDQTEENPDEKFLELPLRNFIKDIEWDNKKGFICTDMAKRVISNFARFRACRFIPLFLVRIENDIDAKPPCLDISMLYFRFPNDEEMFQVLRYHNEKDFYDLGFLEVIRVHIPILLYYPGEEIKKNPLLDIKFRKLEYRFPGLDDELKELMVYFLDTEKGKTILQGVIDKEPFEHPLYNSKDKLEKYIEGFLDTERGEEFRQKVKSLKPEQKDPKKLKEDLKERFASILETTKRKAIVQSAIKGQFPKHQFQELSGDLKKLLIDFVEGFNETTVSREPEKIGSAESDNELEKRFENLIGTKKGKQFFQAAINKESDGHKFYGLDNEQKKLFMAFRETKACKEILENVIDKESNQPKFQDLNTRLKDLFVDFIVVKIGREIFSAKLQMDYLSRDLDNEIKNLILDFIKDLEEEKTAQKYIEKEIRNQFFQLDYEQKKQLIEFLRRLKDTEKLEIALNNSIEYRFYNLEDKRKQELIDFLDHLEEKEDIPGSTNTQASYDLSDEQKKQLVDFITGFRDEDIFEGNQLYGMDEKAEKMLFGFSDTLKGLELLQRTIEESKDEVVLEDRFPYTARNRKAIFEFSQSILDPEIKNKVSGRKKVFYETSDLVIPSSFELMAVLHLFLEEEEEE